MNKNDLIQNNFYKKLDANKIKINWNKNPVEMSLFLSFLKVEVVRCHNHLGSDTGWTLLKNDEFGLNVSGGIIGGKEFLDSLQFGKNLMNPYNNYVNPFYLFEILSKEGQDFFINYYKDDIDKILSVVKDRINGLKAQLLFQERLLDDLLIEVESIYLYNL